MPVRDTVLQEVDVAERKETETMAAVYKQVQELPAENAMC